jgi:hypothetical protein
MTEEFELDAVFMQKLTHIANTGDSPDNCGVKFNEVLKSLAPVYKKILDTLTTKHKQEKHVLVRVVKKHLENNKGWCARNSGVNKAANPFDADHYNKIAGEQIGYGLKVITFQHTDSIKFKLPKSLETKGIASDMLSLAKYMQDNITQEMDSSNGRWRTALVTLMLIQVQEARGVLLYPPRAKQQDNAPKKLVLAGMKRKTVQSTLCFGAA